MNRPNKAKLFSEVVALSTWRTPFDGDSGIADIYADVVFGTGHIGAEVGSPVRFKLSLSRAEIHLIVPETEPAKLVQSTVASADVTARTRKTVIETEGEVSGDISASMTAGLTANAAARGKIKAIQREEREELIFEMHLQDRPRDDGHIWEVSNSPALKDRPWSRNERRAELKLSQGATLKLPPSARFEVKCRRQDLKFSEIVFKGEEMGFWDKLTTSKQVVVESYLRDEMAKVGLEFENFNDPFGVLVLADDVVDE